MSNRPTAVAPGRRDERPSAAEVTALRARLVALGYRAADLSGIVATSRTRRQIVDALIAVQRQARKEER